ncbi:MAG: CoA:oxalate CoA-transferase, partial [Acidimicrobiales bacterium]
DRLRGQQGRSENMAEVDALVTDWSSKLSKFEAATRLQNAHVPAAAVRTVDEVVHDANQIDRKAIQWIHHPELGDIPLHASPIRWHDSDLVELVANRALGADNDILDGL